MPNDQSMLPEVPALAQDDSMLTRKFGKEVVNYYSGSRLNRFSFLRADTAFLRKAATNPSTQYVALQDLNPLIKDKASLATLTFDDVKPLIGPEPFRLSEDEAIKNFDSLHKTPLLVFLGMLESPQAVEITSTNHGSVKAQPLFAIDITPRGNYADAASKFVDGFKEKGWTIQSNPRAMTLLPEAASVFAQARSMLDWNARNQFCAGCGNPTLSVQAGYKRVCPPTDRRGNPTGSGEAHATGECATRKGVSNLCFPRTDPTMIAAVVSADGQRILLGRQAVWPPHFFSTLAGFLEPGESMEEAVRREVWEEAGVMVGRVVIHSTQPWPYPSSLMIGAIAQAVPGGEDISLNDKELDKARWVTLDEVREALVKGVSALGAEAPPEYKEGDLRLPPSQAIANRLITAVAEGYLSALPKI